MRGYLAKLGSLRESSQRQNTEPLDDSTRWEWVHEAHRPACSVVVSSAALTLAG